MQKSVNKLMYYPLRDDIPCRRVMKSKARAADNATSLRGLTMKLYRQRTDGKAIY